MKSFKQFNEAIPFTINKNRYNDPLEVKGWKAEIPNSSGVRIISYLKNNGKVRVIFTDTGWTAMNPKDSKYNTKTKSFNRIERFDGKNYNLIKVLSKF